MFADLDERARQLRLGAEGAAAVYLDAIRGRDASAATA